MYHFVRSFKDGGIEELVMTFLETFPSHSLVVISGEISELKKNKLKKLPNTVILINKKLRFLIFSVRFLTLLKQEKIIFWYEELCLFSVLRFRKKTTIHLGTAPNKISYKLFFKPIIQLFSIFKIVSLIAPSHHVSSNFFLKKNIKIVPNFITKKNIYIGNYDHKKLLFVGRWETIKNISLIEKFARFFPELTINCYGDKGKSLLNNIHFNGIVENPFSYDESTLLFFPSKEEGFGLILLEALISEKKIITWEKNISKELLKESSNVLFLDPYNLNANSVKNFLLNKKRDQKEDLNLSLKKPLITKEEFINEYLSR